MSILLIQISDIHFKGPTDLAASRHELLARAAIAKVPHPEACFLLLTGDIANSGAPDEYQAFHEFLEVVRATLTLCGIDRIEVVAIPGNHDLNLRGEPDTRKFVLDSLDNFLAKPIDLNGTLFGSVISVQRDFFDFEAGVSGKDRIKDSDKLYYQRGYKVGEYTLLFHCFNTSWLSRRNEIQAQLHLPTQVLNFSTPADVSLSVALLHHPYNWLDANNARALKKSVDAQIDLVLTGHEHDAAIERSISLEGVGVDYLKAPAFQDPTLEQNGFQLLEVDFTRSNQLMVQYSWIGDRFSETGSSSWTLQRNSKRPSSPFTLRSAFLDELNDVGTGFRHPRCVPPQCHLRLRDLFVYPNLTHQRVEEALSKGGAPTQSIQAEQMSAFVYLHKRVLIFGADDCGKTAFSKIQFQDLRAGGFFPLLLKGESLRGNTDDTAIVKLLSRAVLSQYASSNAEPYLQADLERKVLIIDDLDKSKQSRASLEATLELLSHRFRYLIAFVSDIFQLHDATATKEHSPLLTFERCAMKEFGRYHRQKLVHAWLSLGRDETTETFRIEKQVAAIDKTLSTLLGRNLVPHYPLTILMLLQLMGSKEIPNTSNGAYGYMYEVLLKTALASVNPNDVDEKITYLSGIGYAMFRTRQAELTEEELRNVHNDYCTRYDMVRDFSVVIRDLERSEILVGSGGVYRFKYQYGLYYSAAKYFQNHQSAVKGELLHVADHIYGERNANVLIVYVYLTKDEELIRHILVNASQIYASHKPCDMEGDIEFLNKMSITLPPPLILECGTTTEHRDEHNRRQDSAAQHDLLLGRDEADIKYSDQLEDLIKITISFKTLQILGQILRNFTGSLEGPLKMDITKECYALGMRTLAVILTMIGSDLEGMRQYMGGLISERSGITDEKKLASKTDDAIVWLSKACAFGAVKRISHAVGHTDLVNTYSKLLEIDTSLSTRIVDATIKLDHFDRVPDKEFNAIEDRVRENRFAFSVVRDLIADYLYLFEVDFQTKQKLGSKWKISVSDPRFRANSSKR